MMMVMMTILLPMKNTTMFHNGDDDGDNGVGKGDNDVDNVDDVDDGEDGANDIDEGANVQVPRW